MVKECKRMYKEGNKAQKRQTEEETGNEEKKEWVGREEICRRMER